MIFKTLMITVGIWITVYSASYAVFERSLGNKKAATAVFALCFLICTFTVFAVVI